MIYVPDARLTVEQRIAATEGLIRTADGAPVGLTFTMNPDLRAIMIDELVRLRDELRRSVAQ